MNNGSGIKALTIIHKVLLVGQILFIAICFFLVSAKMMEPVEEELDRIFQVVALVISGAGFFVGVTLFKKKILLLRNMEADAKEKFSLYRAACIFQWALMEAPCLFCIVCFFLTGNYAFVALAAVLILLFAMQAPSKVKIAFHLGLRDDELEDL
jgi:ABC-type xylose transport system permease subunit